MKGSKFIVSVKVNEQIYFANENRKKGVDELIRLFDENELAEEIKVYLRGEDNLGYDLVYSDHHRKIGF